MSTNYVKPGKTITCTAPAGGVVAWTGYLLVDLFVVATGAASVGAAFEGAVEGIFDLPKESAETWLEGQAIYWDVADAKATNLDETGANVLIGCAVYPAAAALATTGRVRLNGCVIPRVDFPVS